MSHYELGTDLTDLNKLRFYLKDIIELTVMRYIGIDNNRIAGELANQLEKVVSRPPEPLLPFADKWFEKRLKIADEYALHTGNHWSPLITEVQIPHDADERFAAARGFGIVPLSNKMLMQDEGRALNICTGFTRIIDCSKDNLEQFISIRDAEGKRLCALPTIYGDGHAKTYLCINMPDYTHIRFTKIATAGNKRNLDPPAGVYEAIEWLRQELRSQRIKITWEPTEHTPLSRMESITLANRVLRMFMFEDALKVDGQSIIPDEYHLMDIDGFLNKTGLRAALAEALDSHGHSQLAAVQKRIADTWQLEK